jgi:hypothetical protein
MAPILNLWGMSRAISARQAVKALNRYRDTFSPPDAGFLRVEPISGPAARASPISVTRVVSPLSSEPVLGALAFWIVLALSLWGWIQ